ncbi:outer membrane protein assembly factor BamE [Pandoraea thiooxydans]|uniref:outer membrane protein assembly factor BamE n=1 Tax=Pandoraea thiooxydans TaxID=445709 RepID=UPI0009F81BB8|nr:outer membrane protein assembly factor BamE [Pandoraea thiooxydans]
MRRSLTLCVAGALLTLAGCSTYNSVTSTIADHITPYRINIVQGNFVSKEAYSQLHKGMTREQVRLLIGTPLLTDMFHDNRWDYIFYFKRGNTEVVQERRLTLNFEGDQLVSWSGGENLPSENELVREIDGQKGKPEAPEPASAVAAAPASSPAAASAAAAAASAAAAAAPAAPAPAPAPAPASEPASASSASAAAASQPSGSAPSTVPTPPITSQSGMFVLPK